MIVPCAIGLVGRARAGKDTAAEVLAVEFGFEVVRFADPLKLIAADLFGLSLDDVHGRGIDREAVLPEWGLSIRQILQRLGTEVGRSLHPDVWVRYAARRIAASRAPVVVPDVRFANEVQALRALGGVVWRISRPGGPEVAPHPSEALAADPGLRPDLELVNDGTLDDFRAAVFDAGWKLVRP